MAKAKRGAGQPPKVIDIEQLEKLAAIGATQPEVASFLGVSLATIENRLQLPEFRDAWDRGQANLKLSLRRQQVLLADKGNVTMLIWLGKNLLGQRDNIEVTGKDGSPMMTLDAARALLYKGKPTPDEADDE